MLSRLNPSLFLGKSPFPGRENGSREAARSHKLKLGEQGLERSFPDPAEPWVQEGARGSGGGRAHLHQLMPVLHGLAGVGQHLGPVLAAVRVGGVGAHAAHAYHLVVPDAGKGDG